VDVLQVVGLLLVDLAEHALRQHSEKPMIALSGVRSSCDMLARNSDLCLLATRAARSSRWISRNSWALRIAITAWSAKVRSSAICFSLRLPGASRRWRSPPMPAALAHHRATVIAR
jgi:hypothetical protein